MEIGTADSIARTKKLTREVLAKQILPEAEESTYFTQKKKELLSDLGSIASRYDLEESVIIYCFLCMWEEGLVTALNFWDSFNDNRGIITDYIDYYYENLSQIQQNFAQE